MRKIIQKLTAVLLAAFMMCSAGGEELFVPNVAAYAASNTKLPAPKKLKFYKGNTSVTVSWDAVPGADGYKVGRYDPARKKYIYSKLITETFIRIPNLKESTSYKFVVASYDKINGKYVEQSVSKAFKCTTLTAPKSIKLSAKSKSVAEKKSVTVKATISPSKFKDVKWSISNKTVAEVIGKGASCAIVGLKAGTATLTAVAGSKKASCKITVTPTKTVYPTERAQELLPDSTYYFLDDTTHVQPLLNAAEKRKQEILNSKTEIVKSDKFIRGETYTGTAYYVSPNGDDANDGLTPETAWKTTEGVNWRVWDDTLKDGDAVFFERGGIYRMTTDTSLLFLRSNVTYSAYGEGAKPVFTVAQENSAREECWQLYYDKDGKKIWKYYKELLQTEGIIFDDTDYAGRVWEWPTPKGWEAVEMITNDPVNGITYPIDPFNLNIIKGIGVYPTVEDNLKENLTFICRTDISDITFPVNWGDDMGRDGSPHKWSLYLRCDEGNPGTLYNDVEIIAPKVGGTYHLFYAFDATGFVLDNISLKYYCDSAVFAHLDDSRDVVVQNCTVEWGGNRLFNTMSDEATIEGGFIGDGIYGMAANSVIRDNYMHHSGNGCTFEIVLNYQMKHKDLGTYTCTGNVIENCAQAVRTYLIDEMDANVRFDEICIEDNYLLYSGNSLNSGCFETPCAIDLGANYRFSDKITVSNNVIVGSTLALMRLPDPARQKIDFSNNTFVQERGKPLTSVWRYIDKDHVEFVPFTE